MRSQVRTNNENLNKRYASYHRQPRTNALTATPFISDTAPSSLDTSIPDAAHTGPISVSPTTSIPVARRPARRWILDPHKPRFIGPLNEGEEGEDTSYIRLPADDDDDIVDTIDDIDVPQFQITKYEVGDYVLRRYPPSKTGKGNPNKYGSYWRGPYLVTQVKFMPDVYSPDNKAWYMIQNLITTKEYTVDVNHLRPFIFDPRFVTPINIAAKDTDETVVKKILSHDFSDPDNKRWRVLWALEDGKEEETWETREVLKDVEAFHHYCATHRLNAFLPRQHPQFSASAPQGKRFTPAKAVLPSLTPESRPPPSAVPKKRGRPKKASTSTREAPLSDTLPPEDA
jgi:hypothetical protein